MKELTPYQQKILELGIKSMQANLDLYNATCPKGLEMTMEEVLERIVIKKVK